MMFAVTVRVCSHPALVVMVVVGPVVALRVAILAGEMLQLMLLAPQPTLPTVNVAVPQLCEVVTRVGAGADVVTTDVLVV